MESPNTENSSPAINAFRRNLEKLIKRFEPDKSHYESKDYPEAQARVDFINPLFRILGWDVENEEGLSHHDREVVVERGEKDTPGRPDYSFRVAGQTKFFVEAKAPSESLDDPRHIFQAKSYAWSTNSVSFVILTNFEEFRFYDATLKPDERKPTEGLLLNFKYNEYPKAAPTLFEFSRDRVRAGALEAFLPRDRRTARLRIPPDESFLDQMTAWREDLARNVYKNNSNLTAKQLNEIVQRLLDRIVFIRIAEDRRVVEKNLLRDVVDEWKARGNKLHIFDWLNDLFHRINEDFNGEIFKPHLSEEIKVDSEALAHIIENLYAPKSPFRFDVIGVELLGSIYERYLGKTIRPTSKQVRVEDKPEVRKAGGVYYTPKYIVDYIVKNTVGKIIEGKTPKQIEKIHILDPACGSGSFLIGAFQYLIDYHVRYLVAHPEEVQTQGLFPDLIKDENGGLRLSVVRKADVLKNNLFGVDIDPQAVEITMMSLYLKAIEGERSQLPPKHHILPELKYNIICGNSLIASDFFQAQQLSFLDEEGRARVNVFNWDDVFSETLRNGGFDVVIGNPPYVRQESLAEFKAYFQTHFQSFDGAADLYAYFMEKGVRLVRPGGRYSIIVSSSFLRTGFAARLRSFLKDNAAVIRIVDFGGLPVFENAKDTYVCIPLFAKQPQPARVDIARIRSLEFEDLDTHVSQRTYTISSGRLSSEAWPLTTDREARLFDKVMGKGIPLGRYVEGKIFYGIKTGLNEAFELNEAEGKRIRTKFPASRALVKNIVGGENIRRYLVAAPTKCWIVIPSGWTQEQMRSNGHNGNISEKEAWLWLNKKHKAIAEHLRPFEARCRSRQDQGEYWWELRPCDYYQEFDAPKIIFPDIAKSPRFHLDGSGLYLANTAYCLGLADKYLLGILNSRLFWFAISNISIPFGVRAGEFRYRLIYQYMEKVPIHVVDQKESFETSIHDRITSLVDAVLKLNAVQQSEGLSIERKIFMETEGTRASSEIDNLVYELYGITTDERKIIEEISHDRAEAES
jgi:type I restriction-modification system DNA methylase subunit